MKRILVAITGASGAVYGVRLLQHLRALQGVQSHLLLSNAGVLNAHLGQVTAGVGTSNQTVVALGDFEGTSDGWQSWVWVPLTAGGQMVSVPLNGVATLRCTTEGNVNYNYFMLVPAKQPVSLTCAKDGAGIAISIPTQAGASYTLQYKDNLLDAAWKFLTIVQGDGTTKSYTDATAAGSQRFYRALVK